MLITVKKLKMFFLLLGSKQRSDSSIASTPARGHSEDLNREKQRNLGTEVGEASQPLHAENNDSGLVYGGVCDSPHSGREKRQRHRQQTDQV